MPATCPYRLHGGKHTDLIAAPIKVNDTMVGVLNAESTRLNAFKPGHEDIIAAIAAQVAMALQRARLFDQNTLFAEVDKLIFADADSPHVIQSALEKVMNALQELEHIQLTDALIAFRRGKDLEIVHSTDPSVVGLVLGIDESICGRAVRKRQTVILGDVSEEPEYRRLFGPEALGKLRLLDNVTLDLKLDPELPLLSLYSFDIVIQNLLQNALDVMPDGETLFVSTSSVVQPELPTGYVHVTVRDTGTGIPEEVCHDCSILITPRSMRRERGLGSGSGGFVTLSGALKAIFPSPAGCCERGYQHGKSRGRSGERERVG